MHSAPILCFRQIKYTRQHPNISSTNNMPLSHLCSSPRMSASNSLAAVVKTSHLNLKWKQRRSSYPSSSSSRLFRLTPAVALARISTNICGNFSTMHTKRVLKLAKFSVKLPSISVNFWSSNYPLLYLARSVSSCLYLMEQHFRTHLRSRFDPPQRP